MIKTVSRKLANITTVSRKSLHPIKTFIYGYSGCIKILPYDSLLKNLYLLHEVLKCLLIALHSVTERLRLLVDEEREAWAGHT